MSSKNKSFEDQINRLEEIVRILENGEVPLEESLKLFQEGTKLVENCGKLLDNAEMQIKKIIPAADGEPQEEVFINEQ